MMHLGEQLDKFFQFLLKTPMYSWYPQCTRDIPWCTEHPSMYSWYPPLASWYPPMCSCYPPPHALMVPSDVFDTPDILMIFPQCTEDPPMYWTTHYTGWFYVCIKSTNGNILVFFLFNCEFMYFQCHTIYCSPVCGKPKKQIDFLYRFSLENVTIWNGPVNIHIIIRYM